MSRLILCLLLSVACSGESKTQSAAEAPIQATANVELLEQSWPIQYATAESRTGFEGNPGWVAYFNRDYSSALQSLDGEAQARIHVELAALYRQAARLHAHATCHLFESNAQESDPLAAQYLLGVAKILLGEKESGQTLLASSSASSEPFSAQSTEWRTALEASSHYPQNKAHFPIPWADVTPGDILGSENIPHYQLPLNGDAETTMSVTDGTTLWLRSIWHEEAAKQAAPEAQAAISSALNPFRLPIESSEAMDVNSELSPNWLFLSYSMSAADINFMSAALKEGVGAVRAHAPQSLYASILSEAIVDKKVSVEQIVVLASRLKEQLLRSIEQKNGSLDPVHSIFSEFAEIGLLHAAMVVADVNGQYRDAGEIRLNMRDLVQKSPKNPLYFIELAAWDTGNKSPMRPQEILHRFSSDFSALKVARAPLDSLHIRISRGSGPGPLH